MFFFLFMTWCLRSTVEGQHEECVQDDYMCKTGLRYRRTYRLLKKIQFMQFGDDHAGKIGIHSFRVDCG